MKHRSVGEDLNIPSSHICITGILEDYNIRKHYIYNPVENDLNMLVYESVMNKLGWMEALNDT